jgi:restriction endonuclease S subunit
MTNEKNLPQYTIGKNGIKLIEKTNYELEKHIVFKKDSLILGLGIEEIGVSINENGCCSPVYTTYTINEDLVSPLYCYYFISKEILGIRGKITKKSTRRDYELDIKALNSIPIHIPPLASQINISNHLDVLNEELCTYIELLIEYNKLKKFLLDSIFI